MSEMVIKDKEEQSRLWLYHKIDDLEKEIADLREENERLEIELRCICVNDSRKLDEIKRLRAKALDWKRWPGERPERTGYYAVVVSNAEYGIWRRIFYNMEWYTHHEITHWAEIPRPEES